MILIIAEGDAWRTVAVLRRLLVAVRSREGDGGGVVVQLLQVDLEFAHGLDDHCREQRGPVSAVEAVEAASEAIIAEKGNLIGLEPEMLRDATSSPRGKSVEGTACEEKVGDESTEGNGCGDVFGASGDRGQIACEEGFELETVEEATDDGCGADFEGFERGLVEGGGHQCLSA